MQPRRPESFQALLLEDLEAAGVPEASRACQRLEALRDRIRRWNRAAGLVSAGDEEPSRLWRHFHESLLALPYLPPSGRLVDLGSGGGFPGLVWGAALDERRVTLIESSTRRAGFLRDAVHELKLASIDVLETRVEHPEELAALHAAVLTTRATGMADLVLEAGLAPGVSGLRVILYLGRQGQGSPDPRSPPPGYRTVAHLPLGERDHGFLLVLEATPTREQ